ncbi:hypothetical protein [Streptomyces sp. NPDC019890]|uniref:hypothetical protein n=1 Tax=Streptomyces sp. NPDC019890 TaxID=3365064 RepID=UPI00384C193D
MPAATATARPWTPAPPRAGRHFADHAWYEFRDVLTHGPALLEQCRPADTAWPEDAAALDRLRDALE